jgi:hypothetical protein
MQYYRVAVAISILCVAKVKNSVLATLTSCRNTDLKCEDVKRCGGDKSLQ